MPKKTRRTQPSAGSAPGSNRLGPLVVTAFVAALAGAGLSHAIAPARPAKPPTAAPQVLSTPGSIPAASTAPGPNTAAPPEIPPPAIVLDLPPAKVALNLGNWSYDRQNFRAAVDYYNEAIRRGIDDPDIRTDLGNAYRFSGDPKTALAQYAVAQKESPSHENSLFNQGGCYLLLGDKAKAVQAWRDYLSRFPKGSHRDDAQAMIAQAQNGG
jgi:hypothetical protein